jgi:hypothetical protein
MKSSRTCGFDPAPTSSPRARAGSHIVLVVLWLVCFGFAQFARAEVRVAGGADAVVIETRGASLEEVLKALQGTVKFRYHSTEALDGVVSGTYSGPLRRVITRLLEGRNYVFRNSPNDLDVVIFGSSGPAQVSGLPQVSGPQPPKDCKYDDGTRVIPVEC